MGFVDGEPVAVKLGQVRSQPEQLLHADGKIGAVEKSAAALGERLHVVELRVPARGAHHDAPAQRQHGAHIFNGRFGGGEVDHHIDAGESGRRQRRCAAVLVDVEGAHAVAALARHFRHQSAGFSLSQHEEQHS